MAARYPANWREESGGSPGTLCWIIRGPFAGRFVNIIGTSAEVLAGETAGDWQRASEFSGHQFLPPRPDQDNTSIPSPPVNTVAPVVTGTAQVGETLQGTTGDWRGSPSYVRAWLRDGTPISGATAATYILVSEDEGAVIAHRVTATNPAGSAVATSAPTSAVVPLVVEASARSTPRRRSTSSAEGDVSK